MAPSQPWYRPRHYIHFDRPIGAKKASTLIGSADRVAKHSFYPFISYQVTSKKVSRDPSTRKMLYAHKERPIAYAAHMDSQIYSYYAWLLSSLYEEKLSALGIGESVLAFRALGQSNVDFAATAFREIRKMGACGAVALDASKFFDTLDHGFLKASWCSLLGESSLPADHYAVFKSLTKFSIVDKLELYEKLGISPHNPKNGRNRICTPEEFRNKVRMGGLIKTNLGGKGIPQGSPISALLSNIYMLDFDREMHEMTASMGGKYYRYCDDILLIVPVSEKNNVAGVASKKIGQLKLSINTKKTEIREFSLRGGQLTSDKPLQYLGFMFDGQRTLIRSAALARYSDKMKRGVKFAKMTQRKRNKLRVTRGEPKKDLFKKSLYNNYSHLGRRNFIRYGLRAAETLEAPEIKKQLKPLWNRLIEEIEA